MTQTNGSANSTQDKREGINIETAKVVKGISLVFSGAVMMLEALHPHVSLEPSAVLSLVAGNIQGLEAMAAAKKTEDEYVRDESMSIGKSGVENPVSGASAAGADPVDGTAHPTVKAAPPEQIEGVHSPEQVSTVTRDDITKIIVRKIKQNRSNNEKIGEILKTYGAAKVSDLPASRYEAFLTDLSAI